MIMPFDPVLMLVAVVAIICYYALKGNGATQKKDGKSACDIYREIGENSSEYGRYQQWFKEHQG